LFRAATNIEPPTSSISEEDDDGEDNRLERTIGMS
jgi:hypothetical protein